MKKKGYGPYSLGLLILLGMFVNPAFGEVTDLQTNHESFFKGDKIEFSGNVEEGSTGLVTIVIRDLNQEFVLLSQATINHDETFEKSIPIESRFTEHGTYSATGFILNMTKGISTEFDVSINGIPISQDKKIEPLSKIEKLNKEELVEEVSTTVNVLESSKNTIPDFVDSDKDPTHYIDRYYSESNYKSWFDRNYPDLTIEEAVGYSDNIENVKTTVEEIITNEIIPEAQASSIVMPIEPTTNDSDIAQISLAIAGLVILFGAVYGVKRQVDNNSRQISINKDIIKNKIIKPIIGSSPYDILQIRLAKGEISLEEFDKLEKKLK